jgi:hypothetical protein
MQQQQQQILFLVPQGDRLPNRPNLVYPTRGMPWLLAWTSLEALQMIVQKYTKAIKEVNSRLHKELTQSATSWGNIWRRPKGFNGGGKRAAVSAWKKVKSPSLRSQHGN